MAKQPQDRFDSAGELVIALDQALRDLDTAERPAATPEALPEPTEVATPTAVTEPMVAATQPTTPIPAAPTRPSQPRRRERARGRWWRWVAPLAVLAAAAIVAVLLIGGSGHSGSDEIKVQGAGLRLGSTITLPSTAGSISLGSRNVWISLPESGQLVRFNPPTDRQRMVTASGRPTAIAAGRSALWVADEAAPALVQFNGDSGARVASTRLSETPAAVAVDQRDSSAWVADASGAISHVALGGGVIGTPVHVSPAATSLAWGEGWIWATNGAREGLIRGTLGTTGSSTAYATGPHPVAVTLDQGVWAAHADGHVTRFNPLPDKLRVNADVAIASELDSIAATEQSPFVWAISKNSMTLYRITNTSRPAVTGTVVFPSPPVALAAGLHSVWVATQDDKVIEIRF